MGAFCEQAESHSSLLSYDRAVVGGVAANQEVRSRLVKLCEERSKGEQAFHTPSLRLEMTRTTRGTDPLRDF